MSLTSNDIALGSGSIYVKKLTSSDYDSNGYPLVDTIKSAMKDSSTGAWLESCRLGHIREGATLSYTPSLITVKDDLGLVQKTISSEEDVKLNMGVITWNVDTLAQLSGTGTVTTDGSTDPMPGRKTLKLGGIGKYDPDVNYLVVFVHQDLKHIITIMGNDTEGFEVGYKKDDATQIGATWTAKPLDSTGTLFIFEDLTGVTA